MLLQPHSGVTSAEECGRLCLKTLRCAAFDFNPAAMQCNHRSQLPIVDPSSLLLTNAEIRSYYKTSDLQFHVPSASPSCVNVSGPFIPAAPSVCSDGVVGGSLDQCTRRPNGAGGFLAYTPAVTAASETCNATNAILAATGYDCTTGYILENAESCTSTVTGKARACTYTPAVMQASASCSDGTSGGLRETCENRAGVTYTATVPKSGFDAITDAISACGAVDGCAFDVSGGVRICTAISCVAERSSGALPWASGPQLGSWALLTGNASNETGWYGVSCALYTGGVHDPGAEVIFTAYGADGKILQVNYAKRL